MNSKTDSHTEPFYSDGVRFGCSRCSLCCRFDSGYVWLSRADLKRLQDGLHLSRQDVVDRYCKTVNLGGFKQLSLTEQSNHDCIFWRDGGCSVYGFRPLQCRSYPFWGHQLISRETWDETSRHCPGIGFGPLHTAREITAWLDARRAEPALNADTLS
jgi:Fe-S-cluster containining protein